MFRLFKIFLIIITFQFANCYAADDQAMSPEEAKQFVKNAVS